MTTHPYDIAAALRNDTLRDAHRLTENGLAIVALGSMFSVDALLAAADYLDEEANTAGEDAERAILHAIASYYRTEAKE